MPASKWLKPTDMSIGLVVRSQISTTGIPALRRSSTVAAVWWRPVRMTPAGRQDATCRTQASSRSS